MRQQMYKASDHMDTLVFTTASRKANYLVINLVKEVKDLDSENIKPVEKELEKGAKNGKTFSGMDG